MATGIYKNGVPIFVTYQAVNQATGKIVTMDVYDETQALDTAKRTRTISSISVANPTVVTTTVAHGLATGDIVVISGSNSTPSINGNQTVTVITATTFSVPVNVTVAGTTGTVTFTMKELGATGRYYATFTPDAEGEWILIMKNTTDNNGSVVKAYAVAGHDLDSVGDGVAGIQADLDNATDGLTALKTAIDANATPAEVATELATYDAPTKAELDTAQAAIIAQVDANETLITTVDTVVDGIQTDLSNATDGLSAIKTAVDAIGSPAMVG